MPGILVFKSIIAKDLAMGRKFPQVFNISMQIYFSWIATDFGILGLHQTC